MGTSPLGGKLTRRIARDIGEPVKRAVGTGGYEFGFVTFDHRHGWWSKRDGSSGYADNPDEVMHLSSCRWLFGDQPPPDRVCGVRAVLDDGESVAYDVVCTEETGHGGQHRCGSVSWRAD